MRRSSQKAINRNETILWGKDSLDEDVSGAKSLIGTQNGVMMAINGLNAGTTVTTTSVYETVSTRNEQEKTANALSESDAVVYSKTSEDEAAEAAEKAAKNAKVDFVTIDRLKADADERNAQLKGLVEKILLKQAGTFVNSEGLASLYRKVQVDPETQAQAQEDISENGYWGVEQTSDRILDFAKALAGDDPELAEKMLEAVKEGFKQAGEEWGEDLPELSQQTMKTTLDKIQSWIDGIKGSGSTAAADTEKASEVTEAAAVQE